MVSRPSPCGSGGRWGGRGMASRNNGVQLVWFRRDLRLADNPALSAAAAAGAVVPVVVWAPEEEGDWPPGGASRWWLHRSLVALERSLGRHRSRLVVRRGPTLETLRDLI